MSRKLHIAPNYAPVQMKEEIQLFAKEIQKLSPKVEVSLQESTEIATGTISLWDVKRKFFRVTIVKRTPGFDECIDKDASIPAYFKVHLLSSQIVFKAAALRKFTGNSFDFRLPEEVFKQQRRGALRVPTEILNLKARVTIAEGKTAEVYTTKVLDLSISGAKLKAIGKFPKLSQMKEVSVELMIPTKTVEVDAKIAHSTEAVMGCRFTGVGAEQRVLLKQFLIEGLRVLFKKESAKT